jgi:spore coat protein U domain-containing protein, fimbrial subunit CupE1/2/3/6
MNMLKTSLLAAAVALTGLSGSALAATASTTFNVKLAITATCTINSPAATDVDFLSHPSSDVNLTAAGTLNVNCTNGSAYTIALDDGSNAGGGGVTARKMKSGATNTVPYQLYSNSARTTVWGSTTGTNTVGGTGTGAVQALSVYGGVASANFPVGSYTDLVTATVTY